MNTQRKYLQICLPLLLLSLLLSSCGFHLRGSAQLPQQMYDLYVDAKGSRDFQRQLKRSLYAQDVTLHDAPGEGIAELRISEARFDNRGLTVSGEGRINEYSVRFKVAYLVVDDAGAVLVPQDEIVLSREFTYDDKDSAGRESQVEVLQDSLVQDMVNALMFRLQAAGSDNKQ